MKYYIDFVKEYTTVLMTEPLNLPVWLYLQYKFMMPATMLSHTEDMQEYLKCFSLNGIKSYNICKG